MVINMNDFKKIVARCKGSISLTVNEHKDCYDTVKDHIEDLSRCGDLDISEEVYRKMISQDSCVCLHFYPDTPIGFYRIFHYDLDEALRLGVEALNEKQEA
jgi:hypothetical protein